MKFERGDTTFEFRGFKPGAIKRAVIAMDHIRCDDAPLRTIEIRNARIDPPIPRQDGAFTGGVFTSDGAPVAEAQIHRHEIAVVLGGRRSSAEAPAERFEEAIYGGIIFAGYGHIILESINRLWITRQDDRLPILFQMRNATVRPETFETVASMLGIDVSRFVYVDRAVEVARLHVPEPGLALGIATRNAYVQHLREMITKRFPAFDHDAGPMRADLCYLSRAGLALGYRRAFGEREFEHWLMDHKVAVARTERHSPVSQVTMVNEFDRIGGAIGSQMHNLIFRANARPLDMAYLCAENPNPNFFQIDMMFPGSRIYAQVTSFEPFYQFGSKAPFRLLEEPAREAIRRIAPSSFPQDEAQQGTSPSFAYAWTYAFITKIVRKRLLSSDGDAERGEDYLAQAIASLSMRLIASPPAGDIADIARAADDCAAHHRLTDEPAWQKARDRLHQLLQQREYAA